MLNYSQLQALLAVAESGSYEGAARILNVTSFAVKQRIKALESKLGVKLIESKPTRPSKMGSILCDHTREVRALELKVIEDHHEDHIKGSRNDGHLKTLSIAVCDEVFADWFVDALDELNKMDTSLNIDVFPASKPEIMDLMRSGEVAATLNLHSQVVSGFKAYSLGEIIYRAVASPDYVAHHFSKGVATNSLSTAPCYRFCRNDELAYNWVEMVVGKPTKLRITRYPSSDGSLKACKSGRVWAMHPAYRVDNAIASGDLVELIADTTISLPVLWHVNGAMVDMIRPITSAVRQTVKTKL